ncbi:hypothetical protein [Penaeicola halotolerans]|uniref:hypothetical protein n=1 Tax=Penaeicola halotolerans TaxID=2793196 RepID=UPI001CF91A7B|nr:hypothetical protein [Penaeicola halotolerans]
MKQSHFSNQFVYWFVLTVLAGLLMWNTLATIITGNMIGLLPITIQGVLIALILTKNQYAKIGIKIWATIFLIIGSGLQLLGEFLKGLVDDFVNINLVDFVTKGLTVILGLLILSYVNKTVEVIDIENKTS